jgi:hypothetical protein
VDVLILPEASTVRDGEEVLMPTHLPLVASVFVFTVKVVRLPSVVNELETTPLPRTELDSTAVPAM